jgi:predicted RNase H-like HicB family nuclease
VWKRVLQQVLSGASDANIRSEDLRSLLNGLGFAERVRGDHHILSKAGVDEIVSLQPRGSLAKPYQIRQVRGAIVRYELAERERLTRYEIILYWSTEGEAFIAEVQELPGCAADGGTRIQALENAETDVQEWIETAREVGRPCSPRAWRA